MTRRDERALPPELGRSLETQADGSQLSSTWELLGSARADTPADAAVVRARTWKAVQRAMSDEAPAAKLPVVSRRRQFMARAGALAAALALVLLSGLYIRGPGAEHRARTAAGEQTTITLPDGSLVELAGSSALSWRPAFGWPLSSRWQRTVRLEGTAFFAVTRDSMPFDVMVVNGSVRVLGTEFEVQARASSSDVGSGRATVVQVVEGRVLVRGKVAQPAVILEAGEISTIPADGTAPSAASPVTVDRIAVWREGGFAAVDATLSGILQDLQAHYGVEMALRNGAVAGRRLTLYYPNRVSARTIIADICTSQGLSFRPTKRGFELE